MASRRSNLADTTERAEVSRQKMRELLGMSIFAEPEPGRKGYAARSDPVSRLSLSAARGDRRPCQCLWWDHVQSENKAHIPSGGPFGQPRYSAVRSSPVGRGGDVSRGSAAPCAADRRSAHFERNRQTCCDALMQSSAVTHRRRGSAMFVHPFGRVGLICFLAGFSILQGAAAASETDRSWLPKGAALSWTKAAGVQKPANVGTKRSRDAAPVLRADGRAVTAATIGKASALGPASVDPIRVADAPSNAVRSRSGGRPCLSATCPGAMILGTSY